MKPLSLSIMLAAACAASAAHGSETEPATGESMPAAIPELYTPATITSSGHDFVAQCDDKAFARTRFPQGLADRCERLLRRWRQEADALANPKPEAPRIPNYADALRSSAMVYLPAGNSL